MLTEHKTQTDTIDLFTPASGEEFRRKLDQLREDQPIVWSEIHRAWIVSRYDDCLAAFAGTYPLSARRLAPDFLFRSVPEDERGQVLPLLTSYVQHWVVNLDPPEQTRLHRLLARAFSNKVVNAIRPAVREYVQNVFDSLPTTGEIDFVNDVAALIPGFTIGKLFDFGDKQIDVLPVQSKAIVDALFGYSDRAFVEAGEAALKDLTNDVIDAIKTRRTHPGDDIISQLLGVTDDLGALTEEEIIASVQVLLIAGYDTTVNALSLSMLTLARQHEDVWDHGLEHESRSSFVEELLRNSPLAGATTRFALEDFNWHGENIKQGDLVMLMIGAANRDPRVFDQPSSFSLNRTGRKHLTFAPGIHHCIGSQLARMQIDEVFSELLKRFKGVRRIDEEPEFTTGYRGLSRLNVTLLRR